MNPLTLRNPRWETFALKIAQGDSPEGAYRRAGFSTKNGKTRAQALLQNPEIQDRIAHFKACLPRIQKLTQEFAPDFFLPPQNRDEMIKWLWQVTCGARIIPPIQLRAANLFIRLNGWHITKTERHAPPLDLVPAERLLMSAYGRVVVRSEAHHKLTPDHIVQGVHSAIADMVAYKANKATPSPFGDEITNTPVQPPLPHQSPAHPLSGQEPRPSSAGRAGLRPGPLVRGEGGAELPRSPTPTSPNGDVFITSPLLHRRRQTNIRTLLGLDAQSQPGLPCGIGNHRSSACNPETLRRLQIQVHKALSHTR